jgi:mannosyltransferase
MYALVMVLVLAGWLLLDDILRRPTVARLAGLSLVVGLLLWTHYWSMWLLAVVGLALIVRLVHARRDGRSDDARAARGAIGALIVGGLLFLPWVPNLLYQGAHTGTPWARPVRPTEMLTFTLADLGGGGQAEALVLGWFLALLMATGLTGRGLGGTRVDIDLATRPKGRPFAIAIAGTLAVGCLVGYATGATYASRYAAVFIPFAFLLAALGLAQLSRVPLAIGLVALLALGALGGYRNVTVDRSDARRSADAIAARADDDALVVYCPDQLGPSTSRQLGDRFDQVTYPRFEAPQLVDWTDYTERLDEVEVEAFAAELLERAGDRQIFLVYSTEYITHEDTCPALFNAIGAQRPPEVLTTTTEAWEPSGVALFAVPQG